MKKSLLALAALSAFGTVAQAQSSVTLYGGVGASQTTTQLNGVKGAPSFQSASQDYLGTTALGLTGTEDLGGGNKAFFRLEGDLSMAGQLGTQANTSAFTGTSAAQSTVTASGGYTPSGSVTNTQNTLFNRHAHVGIETKDFGTFSFGRQNDSIKDLEGLGQVSNLSDNLHMNTQVGDRYASVIKYASPRVNGFQGTYSYSNNAANTGGSSDTTPATTADGAKTLNSYALSYIYKNLSFGAGKGVVKDLSATDLETTFLGARGTFGQLTVGAHYAMNKQGSNELNQTLASVNYTLGNVDLKAHYVKNEATGSTVGTAGVTTSDGNGYGLMGVYNLSKRTAAYVAYADFNQSNATTYDQKVSTIGLFHKF